jgi:hypothetical protein
MNTDQAVRDQLLALLNGGNAHLGFDEAVGGFSLEQLNAFPPEVPYRIWHIVEHLRLSQVDILEYIRDPSYVSPPWPDSFWPQPDETVDQARWEQILAGFRADLDALKAMVTDPATDLYSGLPHAPQHNILREMLIVADHNAYHIGELAVLRQVMGSWPPDRAE